MGGCFGDWSTGLSENWQAKREQEFSQSERAEFIRRANEAKAQAETQRQTQYAEAAEKAAAIWYKATLANNTHPYLVRKCINANGARLHKGALVIPMRSGGELCSLQFIAEDGTKRFLIGGRVSGCYFSIGSTQGAQALCIAEGFATGATIHQATGYPVAVAFNAGNLESVAKTVREHFPSMPLIICADDDVMTEGNPGITKATLAANETGAVLVKPSFGNHRTESATDFNDMAMLSGLGAVADVIQEAIKSHRTTAPDNTTWPAPLPLSIQTQPEPYPLDALPETVRLAVREVQAFTKAPIPLVASSALAAISLAIQAHVDVKREEKLTGPVGLFLLTIADSGERKSTCDGFFMQAIREYESQQIEEAKPLMSDFQAAQEAWEAKRNGIKEKIRQHAKNGKPTGEQEDTLRHLEHDKPDPPKVLKLIYGDATPEALKWSLGKLWPSGGVISSEAGIVFGAHGMGKDSVMRNLATLNQLWDGVDIATERRASESFTVQGARLTIALQVQEATLRSFFDRSGQLARGTGFLARFLIALPESTQGYRPFSEAPESWPALAKFNQRISAILAQDAPIVENGGLSPALLSLSPETKAAWIRFHDALEAELKAGGELYSVRDVASKSADNAARLAALFEVFEHGIGETIGINAFEGAARIAAWHLNEARRFFSELVLPERLSNASHLNQWLVDYCQKEQTLSISRRDIQRNVTPVHLRHKQQLDEALAELVDAERIRLEDDGRKKLVHVNPALIKRGAE